MGKYNVENNLKIIFFSFFFVFFESFFIRDFVVVIFGVDFRGILEELLFLISSEEEDFFVGEFYVCLGYFGVV